MLMITIIIAIIIISFLVKRWKDEVKTLNEEKEYLKADLNSYMDSIEANNILWQKRVESLTERLEVLSEINKTLINKTTAAEEKVVVNVSSDEGNITVSDVGSEKKNARRGRKPGNKRPYYKKKVKTKDQ